MAPEHFVLFVFICAQFHNDTHSCEDACDTYFAAQKQGQRAVGIDYEFDGEVKDSVTCEGPARRRRLSKRVRCAQSASCLPDDGDRCFDGTHTDAETGGFGVPALRRIHPDEDVVCNGSTGVVHCVHNGSSASACGWSFPADAVCKAPALFEEKGKVWWTCGAIACCGRRVELENA